VSEPGSARPARRAPSWLVDVPLAHRGLHGPDTFENSVPAFAAAAAAGYGVELDVRASADGVPVVVHDRDLARIAGRAERIDALTADALGRVRLADGTVGVPTLAEVLEVMAGLPVMVEVKQHRLRAGALELAVALVIDRHPGPVCIAGFHPGTIAWFRRHRPDTVRVLTAMVRRGIPPATSPAGRSARSALLDRLDPHALSHDLAGLPGPLTDAWRARGGTIVTWTVRDQQALARARSLADNVIFEHVRP
jgi:glycerophosphoryl diester phosphodiesterase